MKVKHCEHCGQPYSKPRNMSRSKFCGVACSKAALRAQGPTRFWAKVDKNGPGGCWLYTGFRKWDGYGWVARSDGDARYKWLTAHRYAWLLTNGPVPEGVEIMHICDVPACCNPAHLRLGSHQDNMADQRSKKRHVYGERTRRNKLTLDQVLEILANPPAQGVGGNVLEYARRYGVGRGTINALLAGRSWKVRDRAETLHPGRVRPRRNT